MACWLSLSACFTLAVVSVWPLRRSQSAVTRKRLFWFALALCVLMCSARVVLKVAEEKAAEETRKGRLRRAAPDAPSEAILYSSVPLAQRAAEEYGYVRRDLRRIAIVGGALLLVMLAIDILLNATNVV